MQNIKAIFDIGNAYIKATVFGEEDGNIVVLVRESVKTRGMRKGKILDTTKFASVIGNISENFIRKLGGDFVDEVIIGLSHPDMQIERLVETKRILSGTVSQSDINHLSKIIADISSQENYETIKIVPVYRFIDENKKEKEPMGLQAKKLGVVTDIFRIPKSFYSALVDIFDKVGLEVTDIVPNILATNEAVLDYDQRDLGTMVIDMGANQTSICIYEEGDPILFHMLPIGGEDVTKDISIGLQIDIKDAENIKLSDGFIVQDQEKKLDTTTLDVGFLSDIIKARYEEIFDIINNKLIEINKDGRLAGGVVITGGASQIDGVLDLIKDKFKLASFQAKENKLHIPDMSRDQQYLNVLGLYSRYQQFSNNQKGFGLNFGFLTIISKFFKDLF